MGNRQPSELNDLIEKQELLDRIADLERKLGKIEARRGAMLSRIQKLNPWLRTAVVTTVLAIPLAAYASSVTVPNIFVNGTVADANDVNANFSAVESAINDNDARITTVEGNTGDITDVLAGTGLAGGGSSGSVVLAVDPGAVQSRVAGTCPAGSSIRVIGSDGSVTCQPDNAGGVGTITGVTAGTGLAGGGAAGDISIEVAPSGITTGMILDGTISGNDIDPTTSPTFGGVTITGATELEGQITISSPFDIRILDDFNGFRWLSGDGSQEFGSITARISEFSMVDDVANRFVFRSNSTGLGLGGSFPSSTHIVTVPSLSVTGQTEIGLERVSANYALSSTTTSCHAHGDLTCFYGSGIVTCPVGKRLLGGGTSGGTPRYGSVGQSYPSSDTTWSCSASYDIANSTRNCYALCGRVQ